MTDKEQESLKDSRAWDWERAEARAGRKKPRAVVSVAFNRDDFEAVAVFAERAHMKLSEFIRSAAIGCAEGKNLLVFVTAGSPDAPSTSYLPPSPFTRADSPPMVTEQSLTSSQIRR